MKVRAFLYFRGNIKLFHEILIYNAMRKIGDLINRSVNKKKTIIFLDEPWELRPLSILEFGEEYKVLLDQAEEAATKSLADRKDELEKKPIDQTRWEETLLATDNAVELETPKNLYEQLKLNRKNGFLVPEVALKMLYNPEDGQNILVGLSRDKRKRTKELQKLKDQVTKDWNLFKTISKMLSGSLNKPSPNGSNGSDKK